MANATHGSQCVRLPQSNNPVTDVGGADIRCNVGGTSGVAAKCPAKAGGVVTVEMHQVLPPSLPLVIAVSVGPRSVS